MEISNSTMIGIPRPTWLIRSGGGQEGSADKRDDHCILSPLPQGGGGREPRPGQQGDGDRQLERQAEGEHELQDERQVLVDLGLKLDGQTGIDPGGLKRQEKRPGERKNEGIDQRGARGEQHGRGDQKG